MGLLIQSQGAEAYFTPIQDNTESNDFIQKGFMNEAIVEPVPYSCWCSNIRQGGNGLECFHRKSVTREQSVPLNLQTLP